MLMRSNLEVFAEVASLLHLIIYAGICMALLKLRASDPFWYIPAFRVPMAKAVAGFGGLGCLALVFFMQYLSIAIGCAVIALSALYYLIHIRKQKITLTRPKPRQIDENLINPAILVPIDITREGKSLPQSVLKVLPISKLLLLGFKETPEQSGQEQLEEKYGEEGQEMLGALAKQLEEVSVDYESRLIFSSDVGTQIKELLKEEDLQFILSLKPISALQQLTIPIFHKSQVTQQLISIMYNVQYNHFSKIRILLFVDEDSAKSQEIDVETKTMNDGFFKFCIPYREALASGWHQVTISAYFNEYEIERQGEFIKPHTGEYGLISDIDDTFLISHSGSFFKKIYVLLTRNIERRKTFDGVVQHYRLLASAGRIQKTRAMPFFMFPAVNGTSTALLRVLPNAKGFQKR
jgi:hypothetical protein